MLKFCYFLRIHRIFEYLINWNFDLHILYIYIFKIEITQKPSKFHSPFQLSKQLNFRNTNFQYLTEMIIIFLQNEYVVLTELYHFRKCVCICIQIYWLLMILVMLFVGSANSLTARLARETDNLMSGIRTHESAWYQLQLCMQWCRDHQLYSHSST